MDLEFNHKINEIKTKINIVEIMGKYLTLTHKGNNFWAICPFHEDSTPSLSISPEKQIYKCFACGEQGNVFIFLQKYKNITFMSALREAAISANINLQDFDINLNEISINTKKNPLLIINNMTMNFFSYQLLTTEGQIALAYLQKRNISSDNIKTFSLGYAPLNNKLTDYLRAQGYKDVDLINLGLVKINNQDQINDAFLNRIIFAIKDENGDCVGFSARSYNGENENYKYINSPENDVFKKSKVLYNFNNAKQFIKKETAIYLTEGFMDVIALSNSNIKTAVALMGTNLTKAHVELLKKITKNIIIFLDGDLAGKIASLKIANILLRHNFKVEIINNNTKFDPDELINKLPAQFEKIIKKTVHPFIFAIDFGLTQYDIKKDSYQLNQFLKSLVSIWTAINDDVSKKFYLNMLTDITNLATEELEKVLNVEKKQEPIIRNSQIIKKQNILQLEVKNKFIEAQKQLIFLVMLAKEVYLILEKEHFVFPNQNYMNLYFFISAKYQNETINHITLEQILEELKDNVLFNLVQDIIDQYKNKKFDLKPQIINDYLKFINNELIENEIKNITTALKFEKDINKQIKLLQEISVLKTKANQIKYKG